MGERGRLGSARPSLLRPSSLIVGAAALGTCLVAFPAAAFAGGLAPDPAPATALRPDAYRAPRVGRVVATPAPTTVTRVVVVRRPTVVLPPVHPRAAARPRHRAVAAPKPQQPLPFPTLAIKWFSGAALPAAAGGREVPAWVALALAALVLASATFVAGAAREAVR